MRTSILFALAVSTASVSNAQDTLTSTSGSNAGATSGSISGSVSDVSNAANNNVGTSSSTSGSEANANSGSVSGSASFGNATEQGQGQTQSNELNVQITTPATPQSAQGAQGAAQASGSSMATSLSFNNSNRKTTEIRTNPGVPLAASSSFSSDYCGGTISGGGSFAPLGISLGGAAPKFDKSCQALRRAEKFGMAAANAQNMGQPALAQQLMTMMIWSICTSDSGGPEDRHPTAQACNMAGLMGPSQGSGRSAVSSPPPAPTPANAPNPRIAINGKVTPEAVAKAAQDEKAQAVSR
jgi:hypothetical protein